MIGLERMYEDRGRRQRGCYDVVEVFSPPRICARARERGLRGGWSLDWMTTDPITGMKWDLRLPRIQQKVMDMLRRDRPDMVIACPPCTLFSQLQTLTGDPKERVPEKLLETVCLVDFAVKVCEEQLHGSSICV